MAERCYVTKNPVGTDTWPVGSCCACDPCRRYVASHFAALQRENARLQAEKDGAYEERNRVVALLASLFPSVRTKTAIEGWSDEWHGCIYIETPAGQLSWHFHDSHAHLFEHVPEGEATWDGHTTEQKYERVAALAASPGEGRESGLCSAHQHGEDPSCTTCYPTPHPPRAETPYGGPYDWRKIEQEIAGIINSHSLENLSNTPDFILSSFLVRVLVDFSSATVKRAALRADPESDDA